MSQGNLMSLGIIKDSLLHYSNASQGLNADYYKTFQRLSFAIMQIGNSPSKDYTPVDQILKNGRLEKAMTVKRNNQVHKDFNLKGKNNAASLIRKNENVAASLKTYDNPLAAVTQKYYDKVIPLVRKSYADSPYLTEKNLDDGAVSLLGNNNNVMSFVRMKDHEPFPQVKRDCDDNDSLPLRKNDGNGVPHLMRKDNDNVLPLIEMTDDVYENSFPEQTQLKTELANNSLRIECKKSPVDTCWAQYYPDNSDYFSLSNFYNCRYEGKNGLNRQKSLSRMGGNMQRKRSLSASDRERQRYFSAGENMKRQRCPSANMKRQRSFSSNDIRRQTCFSASENLNNEKCFSTDENIKNLKSFSTTDDQLKQQELLPVLKGIRRTDTEYEILDDFVFSTAPLLDNFTSETIKLGEIEKATKTHKFDHQERHEDFYYGSTMEKDLYCDILQENKKLVSFSNLNEISQLTGDTNDYEFVFDGFSFSSEYDSFSISLDDTLHTMDSQTDSIDESTCFTLSPNGTSYNFLSSKISLINNSHEKDSLNDYDPKPTKSFEELIKQYLVQSSKEEQHSLVEGFQSILDDASVNILRDQLMENDPLKCALKPNTISESEYCFYIDECNLIQEKNKKIVEDACDINESDIGIKVYLPKELL